MKIAIDAHVITGKFQGTRTTLTKLIESISRIDSNHNISLYVEDKHEAKKLPFFDKFNIIEIPKSGPIFRLIRFFPKILKSNSENLAIFQYISPPFSRVRSIVFVHDILPITHGKFFPFFNRLRTLLMFSLSIRKAVIVATVSEYSYEAIQRRYKLGPERMCLIPNGPSFEEKVYSALPHQPISPRYILTVGRIEPRKNIDMLVRAFLRSGLTDVDLIIVGKRDLGYTYQFPKDPRIKNISEISDSDMIDLYRGASLFIYPSLAEGFGLPLLDALLFGVPTISSNQTAMQEIIQNNGKIFDPTQLDGEECLSNLIRGHFNGDPISPPTNAQRTSLKNHFNWDRSAAKLIELIDKI